MAGPMFDQPDFRSEMGAHFSDFGHVPCFGGVSWRDGTLSRSLTLSADRLGTAKSRRPLPGRSLV